VGKAAAGLADGRRLVRRDADGDGRSGAACVASPDRRFLYAVGGACGVVGDPAPPPAAARPVTRRGRHREPLLTGPLAPACPAREQPRDAPPPRAMVERALPLPSPPVGGSSRVLTPTASAATASTAARRAGQPRDAPRPPAPSLGGPPRARCRGSHAARVPPRRPSHRCGPCPSSTQLSATPFVAVDVAPCRCRAAGARRRRRAGAGGGPRSTWRARQGRGDRGCPFRRAAPSAEAAGHAGGGGGGGGGARGETSSRPHGPHVQPHVLIPAGRSVDAFQATRRARVCRTAGGRLFCVWTVARWSEEPTRKGRRRGSTPRPDLGLAVRRRPLPAWLVSQPRRATSLAIMCVHGTGACTGRHATGAPAWQAGGRSVGPGDRRQESGATALDRKLFGWRRERRTHPVPSNRIPDSRHLQSRPDFGGRGMTKSESR